MKCNFALQFALEEEVSKEIRKNISQLDMIAGTRFYTGYGDSIIVCVGGVGKVNAAMSTQLLIERYKPGYVINCGVVGAFHDFDIGKILIPRYFVQHDVDTSGAGDEVGFVSTVNKTGFGAWYISLDKAASEVGLDVANIGCVATGDWFVTDGFRAEAIRSLFDATCVDMEACAIAQVCYRNSVKMGAIKSVSDIIGNEGKSYYPCFDKAVESLGNAVDRMVRVM